MTAIDKNLLAPTPAPGLPFTPTSTIPRSTVQAAIEYVYSWFVALVPSVGAAPKDADYLVKTANATLTAERVVTDGASITADWATAGQVVLKRAALTGDVTAGADANATTIANLAVSTGKVADNAITYAKMQQESAVRVIGNPTSGTANLQGIAAGSDDTILRRVSSALDFGALTIGMFAANLVTYAKIQQVSATSRILGRRTASAGDIEECTLTQVLDFIGSAASGDILYRGSSAWERLAKGSDSQILKLASGLPSWAAETASTDASTSTKGIAKLWTLSIITASDAAWSVPSGTLEMIIEGFGGGGSGAAGDTTLSSRGGGGAAAAHFLKVYHGTMDSTLNITIGAGAAGVTSTGGGADGNDGGTTTVVGANLGTLTANKGGKGFKNATAGSTPGTATGGDINDTGKAGDIGQKGGLPLWPAVGGDCPDGGMGGYANVESNGNIPGGGGACGNHTGGSTSGTGARGEVRIWTR